MMEGPCADSEEKREPAGDIDTVVVDGLKVLDPKRPIREADMYDQPREPLQPQLLSLIRLSLIRLSLMTIRP
jgi:hypothetical protein